MMQKPEVLPKCPISRQTRLSGKIFVLWKGLKSARFRPPKHTPIAVGVSPHLHELDSLAVVRPTPAATSSFPWLSTFEEVYRRHALRYAFPLVQQRHALAEAFLRHPDTLIALPDGKGRKAATTSTWAGLSDRSPKDKPCACRPCTRNEDDQRLLLKITKNRVDAGHTSPPRRRGDGDSANGIGGLQLQLPALHVATEVYEARYEESWTQCSGGVGGCRSSLRRQLQGHDPLHDKASRGYAPYPNRSQARALHLQRRFRVVVVTASSLKSLSDRKTMAMMANKQAYAENHGYVFELGISDVIVAADDNSWHGAPNMLKANMATDAEHRFSSILRIRGEVKPNANVR